MKQDSDQKQMPGGNEVEDEPAGYGSCCVAHEVHRVGQGVE